MTLKDRGVCNVANLCWYMYVQVFRLELRVKLHKRIPIAYTISRHRNASMRENTSSTGLEVGLYGTVWRTGTSWVGPKPYGNFFSE